MAIEIDEFLKHLGPLDEQLQHSTFNYVTAIVAGRQYLLQGRIFFNAFAPKETFTPFEHGLVRAGQVPFRRLGMTTAEIISHIEEGCLPFDGNMHFPPPDRGYTIQYDPLHAAGGRTNRVAVLSIGGAERSQVISQDILDWEVRSADRPYDNVSELMSEYRLGFVGPQISFEAILSHVVEVDHSSRVAGEKAQIGIYMPLELPRENASIGYRVFEKQTVISRAKLSADQLSWSVADNHAIGLAEISVPRAAIVHCVANYLNVAQYSFYASDPRNAPNDRRSTFESFDPDLAVMKEWLLRPATKGSNARDLEAAVSWLCWALGFTPLLIGAFPKMQDAADVIVATPKGNYAVIECTVGMLRAENKLANVVRRANELRDRLRNAGSGHLNVLPVIVTVLTETSVQAELDQAKQSGVAVVTRETLEKALDRTLLPLHPDQIYDEAVRAVSQAVASG
ncbi:hypothetical protein AMJ96_CH02620 [Rhizobium sp. N113]|uniref:hypothetical protein n=1 Tax=unclassified Rhizobium TaxID=2613769 RepID=UPI0007EC2B6A|nr:MULTISPECIES: hypothetical protein [unclassified Rhizobium]ANL10269.1 hypothetical protein AMJ98_CH02613 [Rhizobium sp. N1341]ANL22321.1 hypothetical protein AMJ96_CH02620 [Rhizobium sp. N113]ANM41139.1 hypothetical protein AMK03_CH02650 [Rhizobium sp. N741]